MGAREKERIEVETGPLFSGGETVVVRGTTATVRDICRRFDLLADGIIPLDLTCLGDDRFAVRVYDGEDRCVAAFVFDSRLKLLDEIRAHVAEWLGDDYFNAGIDAFLAEKMAYRLWRKVQGEPDGDPVP